MNANPAIICLLLPLLCARPAAALADPVFGNSPDGSYGYGIYSSYPQPYVSGAAVSFTPGADLAISSATLWLSGYTQPIGLVLLEGTDLDALTQVALFVAAAPNDGSSGEFTFSLAGGGTSSTYVLNADNTYWLFAYGNYTSSETVEWMGGTTPTGAAVYNGTATYEGNPTGTFLPGLNANSPAFVLSAVPEPTVPGLAAGGGAAWLLWARLKRGRGGRAEGERRRRGISVAMVGQEIQNPVGVEYPVDRGNMPLLRSSGHAGGWCATKMSHLRC